MTDEVKNTIKDITINYEDGTQHKLQYAALVGFGEGIWYKFIESPSSRDLKIKMNNNLVELSNKLVESIGL